MIKLNSDRFESAFDQPTSTTKLATKTRSPKTQPRKHAAPGLDAGSGISLYLSQALQSPLLSKLEEHHLAQKISRYRIAFQRLILQEPDVVQHLVDMLTKWELKKLRLDAVCNVALSGRKNAKRWNREFANP